MSHLAPGDCAIVIHIKLSEARIVVFFSAGVDHALVDSHNGCFDEWEGLVLAEMATTILVVLAPNLLNGSFDLFDLNIAFAFFHGWVGL